MDRPVEKAVEYNAAPFEAEAVSSELRRRITHIGMGIFALAVTSFWQSLLMGLSGLALAWVLPKRDPGLLRPREQAKGYSVGIIAYPASVVLLTLLFRNHLWIVAGGWAMMAYGDGMAVVCGQNIRGPKLPWNRGKSLFGTLGFIVFGGLGTFLTVAFVGKYPFGSLWALAVAVLLATLAAAALETLPYDICDNPLVALACAGTLFLTAQVEPAAWLAAQSAVVGRLPIALGVAATLCVTARATRSVDWSGALTGAFIAFLLFLGLGWTGVAALMAFFILGTVSSRIGYSIKHRKGTAQAIRTWRNAVANAGVAAVLVPFTVLTGRPEVFAVGVLASFAAAASDTVAGEIGRVYGGRPFSIVTLRPARVGENGAVSIVGLLAGLATAFLMGALFFMSGSPRAAFGVAVIGLAGMFGNLVDSLLGATVEQRGYIDNEAVNILCTLSGALLAVFLFSV